MRVLHTNAYEVAERFLGIREVPGAEDNPLLLAMLRLDMAWPQADEVPWCSAFVNAVAALLGLPRSKSLRARSWLLTGAPVDLADAKVGFDVAILKRGGPGQPGPEVIEAQGHVGFYAGHDATAIHILGGNQGDAVSVASYPRERVLGVRRLM